MLKYETHIRDPVHGFIGITKEEKRLLDTPAMQRLRNIRQLAMAHLVYPGCNHTRFEHSLGVMHVAGRIVDSLEEKGLTDDVLDRQSPDTLRRRVRYAALLHDVGHPPFCHVTEPILRLCSKDHIKDAELEKIHEKITCAIIIKDPIIPDILGPDKDAVIKILSVSTTGRRSLAKEIISGPLDADKQDYLLRDSHYSGVKYGVFDVDKLIETLIPVKDGKHVYLACKEEGIRVVEQFVVAKYFISEQVYFHKVRIACDDMIVRALRLASMGRNRKARDVKNLFTFKSDKDFISNYLTWDDYKLSNHCSAIKGDVGELFHRLKERRLLKMRLNLDLGILLKERKITPGTMEELSTLQIEDSKSKKIEREIAKSTERTPSLICIATARARFPRIVEELYKVGADDIMVEDKASGVPVKLIDKSTILQGVPEAPMRIQVVIEDDKKSGRRLTGGNLERKLASFIKSHGS